MRAGGLSGSTTDGHSERGMAHADNAPASVMLFADLWLRGYQPCGVSSVSGGLMPSALRSQHRPPRTHGPDRIPQSGSS
jgi:hypothetical protein